MIGKSNTAAYDMIYTIITLFACILRFHFILFSSNIAALHKHTKARLSNELHNPAFFLLYCSTFNSIGSPVVSTTQANP